MTSPLLKLYEEYMDYWATVWKGWARFWLAGETTRFKSPPEIKFPSFFQ